MAPFDHLGDGSTPGEFAQAIQFLAREYDQHRGDFQRHCDTNEATFTRLFTAVKEAADSQNEKLDMLIDRMVPKWMMWAVAFSAAALSGAVAGLLAALRYIYVLEQMARALAK